MGSNGTDEKRSATINNSGSDSGTAVTMSLSGNLFFWIDQKTKIGLREKFRRGHPGENKGRKRPLDLPLCRHDPTFNNNNNITRIDEQVQRLVHLILKIYQKQTTHLYAMADTSRI